MPQKERAGRLPVDVAVRPEGRFDYTFVDFIAFLVQGRTFGYPSFGRAWGLRDDGG
jgi:hypothetical protein